MLNFNYFQFCNQKLVNYLNIPADYGHVQSMFSYAVLLRNCKGLFLYLKRNCTMIFLLQILRAMSIIIVANMKRTGEGCQVEEKEAFKYFKNDSLSRRYNMILS